MRKKILSIFLMGLFSTTAMGFWTDDRTPQKVGQAGNAPPPPTISVDPNPRYELAVCSVNAKTKDNPSYYHLAGVNTVLFCEIGDKSSRIGKFSAFYKDGWRLIQIVNIDNRLTTKGKTVPYSLMYLERRKIPLR